MTEPVRTAGGRWYRPGTADETTWRLVASDYRTLPLEPGDTVLDLGANIGAFTLWALGHEAGRVIAVEPERECHRLWRLNVCDDRASLIEAAVAEKNGTATLWASQGRGTDSHSLFVGGPSKVAVEVETVALDRLLAEHQPQVVKIDIEGGEHHLGGFWQAVPDHVEALAAELHFGKKGWKEAATSYASALKDQGFAALRAPRFTSKGWNTVGVWARGHRA